MHVIHAHKQLLQKQQKNQKKNTLVVSVCEALKSSTPCEREGTS